MLGSQWKVLQTTTVLLGALVLGASLLGGEEISRATPTEISADLQLERLAEGVWRHVSWLELPEYGRVGANGLVVVSGEVAALVDTPWTNGLTAQLVEHIEAELGARVTLAVATHSHQDCMGGLDELHRRGVRSYGLQRTAEIARKRGDTPPQETFLDTLDLQVGETGLELRFLGAGHTEDTIVVWLPESGILFGGCLVKSAESRSLGNTGEAVLEEWPGAIAAVQQAFPEARLIVPGHGRPGGHELLERTLELLGPVVQNQQDPQASGTAQPSQ